MELVSVFPPSVLDKSIAHLDLKTPQAEHSDERAVAPQQEAPKVTSYRFSVNV